MAFVLTLLSGRAALWGTAVWENRHPCCSSFHALSEEMRRVFDRAVVGREAARRLADLRQGERSVSDFSIEFRTLAAECKWNEEAQRDMFLHGLADRIQGEIFRGELPTSLDCLIELALRVDSRLQQHDQRDRQWVTDTQDYFPPSLKVRSATGLTTNPCRSVEFGFPGRRENAGDGEDCVCTVARRDTSGWSVR